MPELRGHRAAVLGGGVAALTCAWRLRQVGWDVELRGAPTRPVPVLLLGTPTVELLDSIWGPLDALGHELRGRVVRWGAEPSVEVPADGLVIEGAALLADLERRCEAPRAVVGTAPLDEDRWVVEARGRAARAGTRYLGRRVVLNARVRLRPDADEGLSYMETVDDGWLFLVPTGGGEAMLQAMAPAPPADPALALQLMLGSARLVAPYVAGFGKGERAVIPAAPRVSEPLTAPGRIAVGDAARAFDPLAGDGTGQAVRGAVLAAAVLESIAGGMATEAALGHYAHRMRLTFLCHLLHCLRFYGDAFAAFPAWEGELAPLRRELRDVANWAIATEPFAHRLADRRLEPLPGAAA